MKARSHEAMQELDIRQKETLERTQAERKRTFSTHMDRLFESLEDKLPFHPLDPNESKTAVLEKLKQDALQSDVAAAGPDVQAYSAAAGVVLPRLIKQFRALAAENNTLKSRLTNNSAASPTKARQAAPAAQTPSNGSADFLENIFSQLPS
jgi:regulator of replication initiation timing